MKYTKSTSIFIATGAVFLFLFLPEISSAQSILQTGAGFIPCSGTQCSACDLVVMANTIIKWLMGLVALLFGILLALAGWGLITSGGNIAAKEEAKKKFVNAFIGFIIVMGAWLFVDTLMRGLIGNNGNITGYGLWSQVQCGSQTATQAVSVGIHNTIRSNTIANNPNVLSTYTGPTGTSAHISWVQNCANVLNGQAVMVNQQGANFTIQCRGASTNTNTGTNVNTTSNTTNNATFGSTPCSNTGAWNPNCTWLRTTCTSGGGTPSTAPGPNSGVSFVTCS